MHAQLEIDPFIEIRLTERGRHESLHEFLGQYGFVGKIGHGYLLLIQSWKFPGWRVENQSNPTSGPRSGATRRGGLAGESSHDPRRSSQRPARGDVGGEREPASRPGIAWPPIGNWPGVRERLDRSSRATMRAWVLGAIEAPAGERTVNPRGRSGEWWACTDSNRGPSRCKRDALTN